AAAIAHIPLPTIYFREGGMCFVYKLNFLTLAEFAFNIKLSLKFGVNLHFLNNTIRACRTRVHYQLNIVSTGIRISIRRRKTSRSVGQGIRVAKIPEVSKATLTCILEMHCKNRIAAGYIHIRLMGKGWHIGDNCFGTVRNNKLQISAQGIDNIAIAPFPYTYREHIPTNLRRLSGEHPCYRVDCKSRIRRYRISGIIRTDIGYRRMRWW